MLHCEQEIKYTAHSMTAQDSPCRCLQPQQQERCKQFLKLAQMLGQPNEFLLLSKTLVYPVCVSVITLFHIAILSIQVPSAVRQG